MRDVVRKVFHEFSAPLEGADICHMYLDSADPAGFVTIATGCLIDPLPMALGLPFVHPSGRPATRGEIAACWALVKERQDLRKHGGMIFGDLPGNTLRLTAANARNLVDKRLTWFDAELGKMFAEWSDWPAAAQLFALSWAWAVGVHSAYPRMFDALRDRDFLAASSECTINPQRGTIVTRNERNRILLRNSARIDAFHMDPDTIDWTRVIGLAEEDTVREFPPNSTPLPLLHTPVSNSWPPAEPTIHVDPSEYLQNRDDDPKDPSA